MSSKKKIIIIIIRYRNNFFVFGVCTVFSWFNLKDGLQGSNKKMLLELCVALA